ncbi:restriction endonuclease subunit S [Microtetraspora sp. NBRC 16547]|uniref:restriction endonuclease subunit S n=1 Tax=Microtetraspora sp. NBRC 16547 TaxID=3030993 RepID=UPI0024A3D41B|nr:restriction endonuclease subunit S [Microtetraspora sp. NBRC 16547]GLW98771.1 restriction modification system S chain-like protein [Microtetraspora sp. NBRC 16547]
MSVAELAPWLEQSRWPTVPIRYVAKLGTGHTPSRQHPEYWEDCTLPWITLADVWQFRDGTRDTIAETKEKISRLGLANSAAVLHPAGTVILSRTASVGFSAIMGRNMATSQDFATWTCGPELEARYLLHALRAMAPDLRRVAAGSTHKTIYMPDIEQLRIPLPPVEEQRRIADFLDVETTRIARMEMLQRHVLDKLNERDRAILDLELDRLGGCSGVKPLRRSIRRIEQGSSPQCDNTPAEMHEWGVLKVSSVKHGRFWPEENKRLPNAVAPERRYEVRPGDLLITRANTPLLVGAAAVVPEVREKLLLCDKIFRIELISGLDPHFVALASRGTKIRDLCAAASHGTSLSMANLKTEEIKEWPIPNVDLTEQRLGIKRVTEQQAVTGALRASINRQLELLAERRQALITAVVTGQIDVTTARGVAG